MSNNLKCFWCTLTAACLHCGGGANCSFTKMTRAFLWDAIPQWERQQQWNDFWAWKPSHAWVMGTLMTSWGFVCSNDKFRLTFIYFPSLVVKHSQGAGGGDTGSLSRLSSGAGWGYALDKTPVHHMATRRGKQPSSLTPREQFRVSARANVRVFGLWEETRVTVTEVSGEKTHVEHRETPHRKAPSWNRSWKNLLTVRRLLPPPWQQNLEKKK